MILVYDLISELFDYVFDKKNATRLAARTLNDIPR